MLQSDSGVACCVAMHHAPRLGNSLAVFAPRLAHSRRRSDAVDLQIKVKLVNDGYDIDSIVTTSPTLRASICDFKAGVMQQFSH